MFDNDLYASMVFTIAFLASICALLFLLARLEQPASERRKPAGLASDGGVRRLSTSNNEAHSEFARTGTKRRW